MSEVTPEEFSRMIGSRVSEDKGSLLSMTLEVAVPLWIHQLETLRRQSERLFWNKVREWTDHDRMEAEGAFSEAVLYREAGRSANAFNAIARALAALSYCPGGVTLFGLHWDMSPNLKRGGGE